MKTAIYQFPLAVAFGLSTAHAKETPAPAAEEKAPETQEASLEAINKRAADELTAETNELRAEIAKLKLERELITERLAFEAAKRQEVVKDAVAEADLALAELAKQAELSKMQAEKLANDLKIVQTESALELTRLQSEIETIVTRERRQSYADAEPVYLAKPLRDDGVLVISDRRIPLDGMIVGETADFVTDRIDYWNNMDKELPIFIVINNCPGGSVMAGYRILKAMETSDAPIHVVVKSFAASMAACITTLAEESYAYPNAVILHHQISATGGGRLNLTQQKEFYQESTKWWQRLATPVAEKMGITTDEFIERMYARSSSGDWTEFGDVAKELKWVNHIVSGMVESSITLNPDAQKSTPAARTALVEEVDAEGNPFVWLPRLSPKDMYFCYNPDGYYRVR